MVFFLSAFCLVFGFLALLFWVNPRDQRVFLSAAMTALQEVSEKLVHPVLEGCDVPERIRPTNQYHDGSSFPPAPTRSRNGCMGCPEIGDHDPRYFFAGSSYSASTTSPSGPFPAASPSGAGGGAEEDACLYICSARRCERCMSFSAACFRTF